MIFPLSANRFEKLDIDPTKKTDGYIWFNNSEKVYKTWVKETLHVFITDKTLPYNIGKIVTTEMAKHEFTVSFSDAFKVSIQHNKSSNKFTFNVYDSIENCNIPCSMDILNPNEMSVEFVDPVTGHIFIHFE